MEYIMNHFGFVHRVGINPSNFALDEFMWLKMTHGIGRHAHQLNVDVVASPEFDSVWAWDTDFDRINFWFKNPSHAVEFKLMFG